MGLIFLESLPGPKVFRCKCCGAHLATHDAIVSKDFHGRYGRAYLFKRVILLYVNSDRAFGDKKVHIL
ncbi:hypothetical protein Taro_028814 [Colocasia esculenta]|uniref:Yippee domain-containing protein n=1 Tax=Colocasia esculenta TaxID=4460 RepID=A0A843VVA8_COLES|nr:hypothetical protein [Colocasia esculenta]